MLSLRARQTLLAGLAVSALPAAADCSKNVPLGMTLPGPTAHVGEVRPIGDPKPASCPGDAVHFPSSDVVFDDGKRRWWNGRPSEWNALHRDDYDKFLDAGYQENIHLKPYCLDRHEVTVGEYLDCVDNGTCASLDPTPLFVQMGLEHRLPDRRGTGTIGDPFHADEYLDETIALFEFDGLDGGYTSTSQLHPHAVCPIAIGGVATASTSELVAPGREGAVVCVKFLQADAFCRARGGRLPTAPEWQFAAMGPKLRRFPWGDVTPQHVFDQSVHPVLDVALPADVVGANLRGGGHALDTTPEGVQDLYGNVMEWADATPVEMLAAEQAKPTLLPGTASCHNCVDPSQVTFAMGTLFPHGRIGHGDNVADSAGWPCDLCEPKVYGWEYRSPYLGFRCAYDARE